MHNRKKSLTLPGFTILLFFLVLALNGAARGVEFLEKDLGEAGVIKIPETWKLEKTRPDSVTVTDPNGTGRFILYRIPGERFPRGDSLCRQFAVMKGIPCFVRRISGVALKNSHAKEGFYVAGTVGNESQSLRFKTDDGKEFSLEDLLFETGVKPAAQPEVNVDYMMLVVYLHGSSYWVMEGWTSNLPLGAELLWRSHRTWRLR